MNDQDLFNSDESVLTYIKTTGLQPIEDIIFTDKNFEKDIKILDIGCGAGRTTFALLEKGFTDIQGVDIAEKLIEEAKNKDKNTAHMFYVGDVKNLDYPDESFDLVFFSYNGIDYLDNKTERLEAFNEILRVLNPQGYFLFSSHNRLCLPTNRNLLATHVRNMYRIFSEYWYTKQSFGLMKTYYSNPYKLEKTLEKIGFTQEKTYCINKFGYPFFQTFPYYLYKKTGKKNT